MASGTIVAINLSTGSHSALRSVGRVQVRADSGLDGDYHARPGRPRALLLMEKEVLDEFGLDPGAVREQITTQGVPLSTLPDGARLTLGPVRVTLGKHCTPCLRMDEVQPGLQQALVGRRGRFVRVHEDGEIAVGDDVRIDAAESA